MTDFTLEDVRRVVREELDATAGLQGDLEIPEQWLFEGPDGTYNVKALYSDNQLAMIAAGRSVGISPIVFTVYHRSAAAVRDGTTTIANNAQGERLRQFMADNPEHYGG